MSEIEVILDSTNVEVSVEPGTAVTVIESSAIQVNVATTGIQGIQGPAGSGATGATGATGPAGAPTEFELRGTGFPEGSVTASVGTYYTDTNATNGAIRWVKASGSGNTGWKVVFGDTGWRAFNGVVFQAGGSPVAITSGGFHWKRVNETVYVKSSNSYIEWGAAGGDEIIPPEGFKPITGQVWAWQGYDSRQTSWIQYSFGRFASGGTGTVFNQNYVYTSTTWATEESWPSSLPGTAV